jgi:hypothetical protein
MTRGEVSRPGKSRRDQELDDLLEALLEARHRVDDPESLPDAELCSAPEPLNEEPPAENEGAGDGEGAEVTEGAEVAEGAGASSWPEKLWRRVKRAS